MKFIKTRWLWVTYFGNPDISFGIHLCMKGRVDIHFLFWMISLGNVPIYLLQNKLVAVSNSFHETKVLPIRSGTT